MFVRSFLVLCMCVLLGINKSQPSGNIVLLRPVFAQVVAPVVVSSSSKK